MGPRAEIFQAERIVADIEGRLMDGSIRPQRRAAAHVTVRGLRAYVALMRSGFDLEQVIAALQAVGGGDCSLPVPATEQSNDVNHVHLHGQTMERNDEPSPEMHFTENGKTRDDHVPSRNR